MTNYLSQFLFSFYNYSPFPPILNRLFGSFAKVQNELLFFINGKKVFSWVSLVSAALFIFSF